jgi:hypothetical protein
MHQFVIVFIFAEVAIFSFQLCMIENCGQGFFFKDNDGRIDCCWWFELHDSLALGALLYTSCVLGLRLSALFNDMTLL